MPIERIESLTYGVADMASCTKYWEDIGLEKVEGGAKGATFRTPTNQFVFLRMMDDPALPKAPEDGPTMREPVWGVDSKDGLEKIAAELSKDREVTRSADGILHARDETGFAIAFGLTSPTEAAPQMHQANNYKTSGRINQRVAHRDRAKPTRIGHIVYLIKNDENKAKASSFYLDRLGFKLTDRSHRVGDFMRVHGPADHHSILLMWIRQRVVRFDHAALELPGFDDVLATGAYMTKQGWKSGMGPGRQSLGSHVYWHFDNPSGGEIEYFTDMDRFDDSWQPKVWDAEEATPGAVWILGEDPGEAMRRPPVGGAGGPPAGGRPAH
jgi:catechol 2,3-dioxygenase-like lactoylglutathione lyase family enzyme